MNSHLSTLLKSSLLIPSEERDSILALASLDGDAEFLVGILSRIVEEVDRAAEEDPGLWRGLGGDWCREVHSRLERAGFRRIGEGSSRTVFSFGDLPLAIKVVSHLTQVARAQNLGDLRFPENEEVGDLFPQSWVGDSGGLWVIQEEVIPLSDYSDIGASLGENRLGRINSEEDWKVVICCLKWSLDPAGFGDLLDLGAVRYGTPEWERLSNLQVWDSGLILDCRKYLEGKFLGYEKEYYSIPALAKDLGKGEVFQKILRAIQLFRISSNDLEDFSNWGKRRGGGLVLLDSSVFE